jgi:hypothetical protein
MSASSADVCSRWCLIQQILAVSHHSCKGVITQGLHFINMLVGSAVTCKPSQSVLADWAGAPGLVAVHPHLGWHTVGQVHTTEFMKRFD